MQEELRNHPGVFWLDSKAIINSNTTMSQLFKVVRRTNGISLMVTTGHSTYAVTHPQLYEYIPSNISTLKETIQWGATIVLIYRTEEIYTHIISWWVLCSLQIKCAQPMMNRFCNFKSSMFTQFADCHRYDQSSLNILLANHFKFDDSVYYSDQLQSGMFTLKRQLQGISESPPKICSHENNI